LEKPFKEISVIGVKRDCVESLERRLEWGVHLINTIKKPFESLIADINAD
jgi:hypothetical protein